MERTRQIRNMNTLHDENHVTECKKACYGCCFVFVLSNETECKHMAKAHSESEEEIMTVDLFTSKATCTLAHLNVSICMSIVGVF